MSRIADDISDGWEFPGQSFPNGLRSAFDNLAKWAQYAKPGNWPDADMLPWGSLTPHPGWGRPRQSRLTQDEVRTQFTLWAVARSPLILGGNLTALDDFTRSLLSNREIIAVNQKATVSEEIAGDPAATGVLRVWSAATHAGEPAGYLAVFNLQPSALTRDIAWPGALAAQDHAAFDIWNQRRIDAAKVLHVDLPPHTCALFRIER